MEDPLPDLDRGLLLDDGDVPGKLLEHVDELHHDAAPVGALLKVHAALELLLPGRDKLEDEVGGGELVTLLGDHLQDSCQSEFEL